MENESTRAPLETALYLIPVELSDGSHDRVLPAHNATIVSGLRHFIVENVRSARRFIKRCDRSIDIDTLWFGELNGHTPAAAVPALLDPLSRGCPMGVISEAGCPAVADPGADVVAIAQQRGYKVVPLVGPSSIIMGLMGSGFNGQRFAFNGYLPIEAAARSRALKLMQQRIAGGQETQIFIETPYRNNTLLADLTRQLPGHLRLCVATDITGARESIVTLTVEQWRRRHVDLPKLPTIFLLNR